MDIFGMFRARPVVKPPMFPQLTTADQEVIATFAIEGRGKDAAVKVYRDNLPRIGKSPNVYMQFMAEVDTDIPDLGYRAYLRDRIQKEHQ